jgi:hypothetical protein
MPVNFTIIEETELYRRFPIEPHLDSFYKIVEGKKIPSSAAFKTKANEDGLSIDIAELTTPAKSVLDDKKFGLAKFLAKIPLEAGLKCVHDPKPNNSAHALILGDTKKIAKKLSLGSIVIISCA